MLFFRIDNKFLKLKKSRSHKYITRKPDGKGGWFYTYNKKKGEGAEYINYYDMREFGYEKAIKISHDIESIRNQPIEHCKCYDDKGNIFFKKTGNKSRIDFTDEEQKQIKNSILFIHNHPSDDSFSPDDFYVLMKLDIKEIRSAGRNTYFSLKIKKEIPQIMKDALYWDYNEIWIKMAYSEKFYINPARIAMDEIIKKKEFQEYLNYENIK
jgi:hypothetical protein